MTTRASTARGQDKQQFQGRVRKWRKQWDLASDSAKYKLLKWVPTEERTEDKLTPRFPNLLPIAEHSSQRLGAAPLYPNNAVTQAAHAQHALKLESTPGAAPAQPQRQQQSQGNKQAVVNVDNETPHDRNDQQPSVDMQAHEAAPQPELQVPAGSTEIQNALAHGQTASAQIMDHSQPALSV